MSLTPDNSADRRMVSRAGLSNSSFASASSPGREDRHRGVVTHPPVPQLFADQRNNVPASFGRIKTERESFPGMENGLLLVVHSLKSTTCEDILQVFDLRGLRIMLSRLECAFTKKWGRSSVAW